MEDGKNAVAGLDEIEFGLETLKLAEITSKQGGMGKSKDLNSIILTVTWPAPSGIAFASYSSMNEARSKRAQLENKIFNGRKVKTNIAKKPATLPEIHWNPATISISGLNPGTPLTSIQEFCGTTTVRMPAKNARSYDLNSVIPSLRSLVVQANPENHQSLTYEPNLVPNENGLVTVKIRFPTWGHAKVVRDFLDQKPVPQCTQTRFFASLLDPHSLYNKRPVPSIQGPGETFPIAHTR
jgi:hypothetical protein